MYVLVICSEVSSSKTVRLCLYWRLYNQTVESTSITAMLIAMCSSTLRLAYPSTIGARSVCDKAKLGSMNDVAVEI
jgi:hypothetical protein